MPSRYPLFTLPVFRFLRLWSSVKVARGFGWHAAEIKERIKPINVQFMLFSLYKEGGVRCRHILSMVNGAKNWVFTLNNYSEQDVARLRECFGDETTYQYAVFGREVGKCGTRHLQGAVCCTSRRSLQYVRRTIDQQAHFEIMRGTSAQAAEYCKKDGQYEEFGTLPSPIVTGKQTAP